MGFLKTIGRAFTAIVTVARFIPGPWSAITNVLGATLASTLFAVSASSTLGYVQRKLFGPKVGQSQLSRLSPSLDPACARKIVFGQTALNCDVRYWEPSGADQEYIDYIIATSAHEIESVDQIWFENKIVWNSSTGPVSEYVPYLTVDTRLVGTAANYISINGGSKWGSSTTLTGCSYIHLRIKRTGVDKKAESPLQGGLPGRVTIKGKGALLYDPRLDSTVAGGSGAMRASDQTTWGAANSSVRDNTALQLLWYLIGWKINGKLSVGCGIPPERIDLPSFIAAANICEQNITLAAGGTQKRYQTAGVCSDSDDRMDVIQGFLSSMNGTLRDSGGKLALVSMTNDLASPVLQFADDDILGDFTWEQTRGLNDSTNVLHGRYTDPSNDSLFQLVEFPSVSVTSVDGIERTQTLDLPWVQDGNRAQRIAKQVLQRAQYRGIFSATFTLKALGCSVGDVVTLSWEPLGWVNKPFRVISQGINVSGQIMMTMIEENAAIYAWDAEERPVVSPTAPTIYDPLNNPLILGISDAEAIADGKITSFYQNDAPIAGAVGDIWIDTNDSNKLYRWDGSAWVLSRDTGITTAIDAAADAQATADGKVTTFYATSAPTAEAVGDLWYNTSTNLMKRWDGSAWVDVASYGAPSGTSVAGRSADTVASTIKSDGIVNNNKVETSSIVTSAVTIPITYSAGNLWVTNTLDTVVVEMPAFLTVGDASGGGFIAVFYGTFQYDTYDSGVQLKIWADTGSGYSVVGTQIVGVPVNGGLSAAVIPVAVSYSVSGISQVKLKVTAAQYKIGSFGVFGYSYINNGRLVVMGGKR